MKRITYALLLFSVVGSAVAAEAGFYVGANVGQANTYTFSLSSKIDTAASILAGYQFNKYVAAEVQYGDLGSIKSLGGSSSKITEYNASVVGIWPFNEQLSVYGRLGYAGTSLSDGYTANRSDVTWGVGGQYNVSNALGIRLGGDSYSIGDDTTSKATTIVTSVGVVYKF